LVAMMIGLIPFSVNFMLQRVFYALEDTRSPFIFTTIQIVVFVAGAYICSVTVQAIGLVAAMSLVMSASFVVQAGFAYGLLTKRIGRLSEGQLIGYSAQVIFAALLAGFGGASVLWSLGGIGEGSYSMQGGFQSLLACLLVGGVSVLVYVAILWLAKNDEVRSMLKSLKGILRR
jgi:putative peptidoglycan lipid II flippase